MTTEIKTGVSTLIVFEDKYLDKVVAENIGGFEANMDLEESLLHLLPRARSFAREKYLHIESVAMIAEWCYDTLSIMPDDNVVGLFFCEEMEQVFYKMFLERFSEFVRGVKMSVEEIKELLISSLHGLEGASAKRLVMQKWGV